MSDIPLPELAMAWTSAPNIIPQAESPGGSGGSGGGSADAAPHADLLIDLGSLRAGEQSILSSSSTTVDQYEQTKSLFLADKDWVYGQQATRQAAVDVGFNNSGGTQNLQLQTVPDFIAPTAQAFADGSNGQPGINAAQEQVLQSVGNVMAMVGEFVAAMNDAGEAYGIADVNSNFPPS